MQINTFASLKQNYDVAIFGSGPAGIACAFEIVSGTKLTVLLCESGALPPDLNFQSLNLGETTTSYLNEDTTNNRARAFGGTSIFWGGRTTKILPQELHPKNNSQSNRWPITFDDIDKHYPEAADFLSIRDFNAIPKENIFKLDNSEIIQRPFYFSRPPVRLGEKYRPAISANTQIDLCLQSTLCGLDNKGTTITQAIIRNSATQELKIIKARFYVLATGGIENARLLLNFKQSNPALSYSEKNIGRYFSVHPFFNTESRLALYSSSINNSFAHYDLGSIRQKSSKSNMKYLLQLHPNLKEEHGLADMYVQIHSVGDINKNIRHPKLRKFFKQHENLTLFENVNPVFGMQPNELNSIQLSKKKDALGLYGCKIHLTISENEFNQYLSTFRTLLELLRKHDIGIGKIDLTHFNYDRIKNAGVWGCHHHLCSTRMAPNEQSGVVDPNLKVFNTRNLYVAGSSVFSTSLSINPTLTIVALSLRLGKHLKALS